MKTCPTVTPVPGDLCAADFTRMCPKFCEIFSSLFLVFGICIRIFAGHRRTILTACENHANKIPDAAEDDSYESNHAHHSIASIGLLHKILIN